MADAVEERVLAELGSFISWTFCFLRFISSLVFLKDTHADLYYFQSVIGWSREQ